jgi:hypothetical protein
MPTHKPAFILRASLKSERRVTKVTVRALAAWAANM